MIKNICNIIGLILFFTLIWFIILIGSVYEQDKRCANGYTEICYIKQ